MDIRLHKGGAVILLSQFYQNFRRIVLQESKIAGKINTLAPIAGGGIKRAPSGGAWGAGSILTKAKEGMTWPHWKLEGVCGGSAKNGT